jgi:hypothetical protein
MAHLKHSFLPWFIMIVLAILLIGTRSASSAFATLAQDSPPSWSIISSPNVGLLNNDLRGVATVSPSDIWAVGFSNSTQDDNPAHTLTEHWNGAKWSIVPSPNAGSTSNFFSGVAAISSNDVWAVGNHYTGSGGNGGNTLIEHWDGRHWSIIPSPNADDSAFNELSGVAAISSNDIWAVGNSISLDPSQDNTLIEHWDGDTWSVVPSPNPGASDNTLEHVAAVSASDVWAVGDFSKTVGHNQALTEHWDGRHWSAVSSPNVGKFANFLRSVTVVSSQDFWAVGYAAAAPGNINHTLTEHWNGSRWSVVPSPNPETASNYLLGVAAISSSNLWAVGYADDFTTSPTTLAEHWNGSSWSVVSSPNRQPPADSLAAAAVISASNIWAVGSHLTPDSIFQTLIEQY